MNFVYRNSCSSRKLKNAENNEQYITEFEKNNFSSDGIILFCKFREIKVGTNR